jgi:hypothetical protein
MANLWDDIQAILSAPFVGPLDLKQLFLLIGVVLVFIAIWIFIIHSISATAAEMV